MENKTPFRSQAEDTSPLATPLTLPSTVGETLMKGSLLVQRITTSQQIVWQKRIVELTKDVLMISKNEKLAAIISLKQVGSVTFLETVHDELGQGATFQVSIKSKEYILRAKSEREAKEWTASISGHAANISPKPVPLPLTTRSPSKENCSPNISKADTNSDPLGDNSTELEITVASKAKALIDMLSSMRAEIQILQQTKCDLEDTVAVTQAQLESLRCQNENDCKDLKEKIHYLESSKKELANELSQSKEVLDKETSRLEQQLSDYVTQLQSVEQKLTANAQLLSSSKIEQDEKVSSLKIEIGELERCKGELKGTIQLKISELSALKAANTESESVLHATIDSLQREKDAYEALVIAKDRVLTETAAEYHQKVMKLEKNLADLQIIQSELEESVCQRDDQLIKFKLEYDSLHTELVSSICEKEGLERTIIEKDRSFLEMTEVKEGQLANLKIEMIALELERKAELQRVEDVAHSVALELQAKCNELSDAELGFQTTRAKLESEINELAASKLALEALLASNTDDATKAIECRMREVSSLKGELSDLLTSKYQLEKQLSEKDKILAKLNAEYVSEKAQFQQEISKLLAIKEQLENSNQENRNLFDLSKTELEKGIQDLTEEVSSLKSERKFLELAITESKAQLDEKANEHNFKVQQLEFEISQCIRSKCDIETELKIAKQIHEEFRTSKTSEIVDIEKRASSLASSKTLFEKTLIEKTNELETSKAAHSEFVKSLQTVLSTTQASVSSLTSLVAEKEGTIINLQASQIELKTQLNDYEKRYVELIEKQQQAEARFSRSVEDKDAFCRQLSDTILNLKNERDKLVEVLATKEVAMNTIQATCEAQNVRSENDLKELKSTIRVLELVNNELEAKNQALLSMTGDFETNINSLKSQVSVLQKKIADLEDDSASKDCDIKCMIVSHEASIVSKKNEIVSLTKTIRSLEVLASENERVVSSKVHTLESSNLALQNKINSFEVQVQHLQKERDTFKELCSLKGEQISSEKLHLSSHLETELYEHKHLLDSAYDALNNTIAEKNEAVDGLQAAANENDRLKETLSSLEVDREDLKSKLSVSESHFVRLKQDYADLVEENKNMIISIGILRERVSVVNNQESMLSEMTSKLIEKDNELSTVHALHLNDVQILTDKVLTLQNHCDKTEFELQAKETAINELKLTQLSQKHVISELTDEINHLTTFFLKKQEPCSLQASYDRAQRMQSFMPSTSLTLKPSMIRRKGTSPNTSPVSSCDMPPISALNFSNVKSPKSPLKSPTRLKRKSITSNAIPPGSLFSFWNQVTFLLVIAVLAAASLVYQFQFPNGHLQLISHDPQVEQQYLLDAPTLKPIPDIDLNSNGVHEKEDRISFRRWFGLDRSKPNLLLKEQEYFLVSIDPSDIHEGITETELALKLYSILSDSIFNEQSTARDQDFVTEKNEHINDKNVFQKIRKSLSKFFSHIKRIFDNYNKKATETHSNSVI